MLVGSRLGMPFTGHIIVVEKIEPAGLAVKGMLNSEAAEAVIVVLS